jgi:hypothetical protein
MKRSVLLSFALLVLLIVLPSAHAQERGAWRAGSKTAMSITGDIFFADEKLAIDFMSFPVAEIRSLEPAEISAAFNPDTVAGTGHLFRLNIPGSKRFLHKNTLCGAQDTQWMATYISGRQLQVAFFSGETMPLFTPDAIGNSTALCSTYMYVR